MPTHLDELCLDADGDGGPEALEVDAHVGSVQVVALQKHLAQCYTVRIYTGCLGGSKLLQLQRRNKNLFVL
jgi:hypothetical protein